jgi:hypothetical protein
MTNEDDAVIKFEKKGGDSYRIPFGLHKNKPIGDVPIAYMRWLLSQDWLADHCRFEIMDELGRRGALFNEAVMQIVALKGENHRLRQQLREVGVGQDGGDAGDADDDFAAALNMVRS